MEATRIDAIKSQIRVRHSWYSQFLRWHRSGHALVVLTTALSTLVASRPKLFGFSPDLYDVFAYVVALLTGLGAAFRPYERAERLRRASTILSVAINRYEADPTYTLNHVLDAYETGEKIIHEHLYRG